MLQAERQQARDRQNLVDGMDFVAHENPPFWGRAPLPGSIQGPCQKLAPWHDRCSLLAAWQHEDSRVSPAKDAEAQVPLIRNRYGKGRVSVMRIHRDRDKQEVSQLNIKAMLEGDFARTFTHADNSM